MWGPKKPDEVMLSPLETERPPARLTHEPPVFETSAPAATPSAGKNLARLGRTLSLKGELAGTEDLIVDGEVEGTINLGESSLTVAPQGRVQADMRAREIVIEGTVRGTAHASDRLHISKSANVTGDLVAARVSIEDGAYFKGSIDIQKAEAAKPAGVKPVGDSFRIPPPAVAAKDKLQ